MTQAFDMMMGRLEVTVGNQDQIDLEARLNLGDVRAFFIQQESRHIDRYLCMHSCRVFLHGFFLKQTQDLQRARLGVTDHTRAVTARTRDV